MVRCEILTPWIVVDEGQGELINHPELTVDYSDGFHSFTDITNQPVDNITPSPNLYIIQVVITEALRDIIALDSKYYILSEETI